MRAMCESRRSCFHTRLVGVSSPTHQYSKCRTCYCHGRPTHDAKPLRPCFGAIAVQIKNLRLPYTLAHENPSFQYQRALAGGTQRVQWETRIAALEVDAIVCAVGASTRPVCVYARLLYRCYDGCYARQFEQCLGQLLKQLRPQTL